MKRCVVRCFDVRNLEIFKLSGASIYMSMSFYDVLFLKWELAFEFQRNISNVSKMRANKLVNVNLKLRPSNWWREKEVAVKKRNGRLLT